MYKRCTSTCFAVYTLVYTLIYTHTRQSRSSWVAPDESGQVKIGLVKMPDDADMFDMDTDHASSVPSKDRHAETQSQAASSSCGELSSAVDCALDRRGSIDLCRRAVPVIVAEADDICSICLDEFTQEDPGMATVCGYEILQHTCDIWLHALQSVINVTTGVQAPVSPAVYHAVGPKKSGVPNVLQRPAAAG